jgi:hypothetical protein
MYYDTVKVVPALKFPGCNSKSENAAILALLPVSFVLLPIFPSRFLKSMLKLDAFNTPFSA